LQQNTLLDGSSLASEVHKKPLPWMFWFWWARHGTCRQYSRSMFWLGVRTRIQNILGWIALWEYMCVYDVEGTFGRDFFRICSLPSPSLILIINHASLGASAHNCIFRCSVS
jgi:hypothetical protein